MKYTRIWQLDDALIIGRFEKDTGAYSEVLVLKIIAQWAEEGTNYCLVNNPMRHEAGVLSFKDPNHLDYEVCGASCSLKGRCVVDGRWEIIPMNADETLRKLNSLLLFEEYRKNQAIAGAAAFYLAQKAAASSIDKDDFWRAARKAIDGLIQFDVRVMYGEFYEALTK